MLFHMQLYFRSRAATQQDRAELLCSALTKMWIKYTPRLSMDDCHTFLDMFIHGESRHKIYDVSSDVHAVSGNQSSVLSLPTVCNHSLPFREMVEM
jgi:hypothetical protein